MEKDTVDLQKIVNSAPKHELSQWMSTSPSSPQAQPNQFKENLNV